MTVFQPLGPLGPADPIPAPLRPAAPTAILCFSHLRWDFVHQRPQHLLTRAAGAYRVFYIEEPEAGGPAPHFRMKIDPSGVTVLTPVLDGPTLGDPSARAGAMRDMVQSLQRSLRPLRQVHWVYTPAAMAFARDLDCDLCVYDCMDELSAFRFASPDLPALEGELLGRADLVFTGGQSLYAAKRNRHPDVHCFPSSVDTDHFARARRALPDPADQAGIAGPRIGFFGVIDERMDLGLVAQAAAQLPDVQFIMIGPLAKVNAADLPHAANLHWLGRKSYAELPAYIANWQAAWMPFALNDATRFISPTKTPEFLAAGLPVTATAVADVVAAYGRQGLVRIADHATIADVLRDSLQPRPAAWLASVDRTLSAMSWASTWAAMHALVQARLSVSTPVPAEV